MNIRLFCSTVPSAVPIARRHWHVGESSNSRITRAVASSYEWIDRGKADVFVVAVVYGYLGFARRVSAGKEDIVNVMISRARFEIWSPTGSLIFNPFDLHRSSNYDLQNLFFSFVLLIIGLRARFSLFFSHSILFTQYNSQISFVTVSPYGI